MRKVALSISASLSLLAVAPAQALYSTSFEAPAYNPGALHNQSGWFAATGYDISHVRAKSGSQSVLWDNEFGTNATATFSSYSGANDVVARVSLWIDQAGASTERSFGLTIWGGNNLISGVTVNSAGVVRAGNNVGVLYTGSGAGSISNATGRWLSLAIRYRPGTSSATVFADSFSTSFGVTPSTFVNTVGLFSDWDATPARSKGYFDDVSVQAVPEPATLAVLGLGVLALRRRRR